jgi:hypothetical protein
VAQHDVTLSRGNKAGLELMKSTSGQARGLGAAADAATSWVDTHMFPAMSTLANGELVTVLPLWPPRLEPLLPPENMSGPDPEWWRTGCLGALFLLFATASPEWMPLPAEQQCPFTAEEEDARIA